MSSQFFAAPRLCKNCRHFINDSITGPKYGKCVLTSRMTQPTVDPVDGAHVGPIRELQYASVERGVYGDCGEDGDLYEHEADMLVRIRNVWKVPVTDVAKFAITYFVYLVCTLLIMKALTRA
jgi:hypothetical protein